MIIPRKTYRYFAIALLVIAVSQGRILSQFLMDDNFSPGRSGANTESSRESRDLPMDVARDIRVEVVTDIRGAVRITWSTHPDSRDDFIVGRSSEVTDRSDRALRSMSIKMVPSGSNMEAIDSNLPPGTYYYCVISKKKILERDVELFPNQNYSVSPAIIEQEVVRGDRDYPQQVSLIYARKMSDNRILITWRGIEASNMVYSVYRGSSLLDESDKLRKAEVIAVITDGRESYVDRNINQSGAYYYAVTTKDIMGNEDLKLTPDQSYTSTGVLISVGGFGTVIDIMAVPFENSIKLTWASEGAGISEFMIYRYSKPISDIDRLALAVFVDKVKVVETYYIDRNPGSGSVYYAVLAKLDTGKVNDKLVIGENFTAGPVKAGKAKPPPPDIEVEFIEARLKGSDIEIKWEASGSVGSKDYKIIRSSKKMKSIEDLDKGSAVSDVDVFSKKYTDKNPPPGRYYYALVPEFYNEEEDLELEEEINVTAQPVTVEKKKEEVVPQVIPEKKPEVKPEVTPQLTKKPEPEIKPPANDRKMEFLTELDLILERYFFKENYPAALEQLKAFLEKTTDANEASKAKLFIGRTLIELKKYREAVDYLIQDDLRNNQNFREEAEFWEHYALARIPDRKQ